MPGWRPPSGSGTSYFFARQYDRAVDQLEQTRALNPNHALTSWLLGMAYQQKGLGEKAIGYLEKGVMLSGRDQAFLAALGYGYGVAGRPREARKVLDELQEVGTRGYLDPWNVALVHAGLGEADQAIEWLNKAHAARSGWMVWLNTSAPRSAPRQPPVPGPPPPHELPPVALAATSDQRAAGVSFLIHG